MRTKRDIGRTQVDKHNQYKTKQFFMREKHQCCCQMIKIYIKNTVIYQSTERGHSLAGGQSWNASVGLRLGKQVHTTYISQMGRYIGRLLLLLVQILRLGFLLAAWGRGTNGIPDNEKKNEFHTNPEERDEQ